MSEKQPIQGPWRVEADTLPEMAYDHYRHTLIHETSSIRRIWHPSIRNAQSWSLPRVMGKPCC